MTNNEAIGILAIVVETAKGRCFVTDEAISDAYAMAIKALEAQELSKNSPKLDKENGDLQPTCNELATDCISRKAVIDALNGLCDRECEYSKKQRHVMCDSCHLGSAFDVLEQLPTQTNTPNTLDCVERQAAIDVLMEFDKKLRKINWYQYPYTEYECRGVDKAIVKIANLPSAQPETHEERTETHACDLIERQKAIDWRNDE